jgi:hypothetical protein
MPTHYHPEHSATFLSKHDFIANSGVMVAVDNFYTLNAGYYFEEASQVRC